ncbi:MAG: cephalosporin hydroxylase family protein [Rhodospirillaceae bacterium]
MSDIEQFKAERTTRLSTLGADHPVRAAAGRFMEESIGALYSYNFEWMGVPIIQYPQDIMALQELIWTIRPKVIVETGVARGGSVVFLASMLELAGNDGTVIGVDIDIRPHNRAVIENHPMARRIRLVQGSSIEPAVVEEVKTLARAAAGNVPILVILDSNHTHDHVLAELRAYEDLVGPGSYLIALDTVVERLPAELAFDRPWGPGDNPMTAVDAFLAESDRFEIDHEIDSKLLISVGPRGYLKCIR